MAILGLRSARGLSLAVVCGLFAAVCLLLRSTTLSCRLSQQLQLVGSKRAQQPWSAGLAALQHVDSFRTRTEPVSPALASEFLTPGPPGKPWSSLTNSNLLMFLEKEMATHPVSLPGKSHGQRSLVGWSSWSHKELGTTERLTHFDVLATWSLLQKLSHMSPPGFFRVVP